MCQKEEITYHSNLLDFYKNFFSGEVTVEYNYKYNTLIDKEIFCGLVNIATKYRDGSIKYHLDGITFSEKDMLKLLKLKTFL